MTDDILRFAVDLRPDPDEVEQRPLAVLCSAAEDALKRRLRSGVSPEDCKAGFVCAAAHMAVDCLESGGDFSAFTAGNVSVTRGAGGHEAVRAALSLLAPFLSDGAAFVGVRA